MAEKMLTNIDKFLIDDLDQLFKPVYGPTKLEEIAHKLNDSQKSRLKLLRIFNPQVTEID